MMVLVERNELWEDEGTISTSATNEYTTLIFEYAIGAQLVQLFVEGTILPQADCFLDLAIYQVIDHCLDFERHARPVPLEFLNHPLVHYACVLAYEEIFS